MAQHARKLLIVDDSTDDQNFYLRLLRNPSRTFETTTCELGTEGVAASKSRHYDCILLDFHLPDINALEFLAAIADGEGALPCAVVIITGQGSERIAVEAMKRGAQDYLIKSAISRESLLQTIENAIEKVELRKQLAVTRRQLAEHAKQMEEASRAKSEFLARMSHELRTPMMGVMGFAELLLRIDGESLSAKQRSHIELIIRSGNQLMTIIEDLLDIAQIEAGALRIKVESVDVGRILDDVGAVVGVLARNNKLTLSISPPPRDANHVYADRARLRQILLNFVSNAVKYNRPDGSVSMSVDIVEGERLRIKVTDTGVGIPYARQAEVFKMFSRLGAEEGPIEGTGIGLAVCNRLSELMNGSIGFASEPGSGSEFWIDLPLVAKSAEVHGESPHWQETIAPILLSNFSLLHIEDNSASVELMRNVVGQFPNAGFAAATTGEKGLAMAAALRPDVIVLDIRLPDISGYEVCNRLRKSPATAGIPIVAVTAEAMSDDLERGRRAGFVKYLTKPYAISALMAAIERALLEARRYDDISFSNVPIGDQALNKADH